MALHAQQGWLAKEMSAMAEREVVTTQLDWLEHELEQLPEPVVATADELGQKLMECTVLCPPKSL